MKKDSLYILFFKGQSYFKIAREKVLFPDNIQYADYLEIVDTKKSSKIIADTYSILKLEDSLHFIFESSRVFVPNEDFCFSSDVYLAVIHQIKVIKAYGVPLDIPKRGISFSENKVPPSEESILLNKSSLNKNKETLNRFIKVFYDNMDVLYYANRKNGLVIFRSNDKKILEDIFKHLSNSQYLIYDRNNIPLFSLIEKNEKECYLKIESFTKLSKMIQDVEYKKDDYIRGIKTLFDLIEGLPDILSSSKYGNDFLKEKQPKKKK